MDVLNMLANRAIVELDALSTVQEAGRIMKEKRIGSLLVVKDGKKVGIVSETDIARKVAAEGLAPDQVTVEKIMSAPIITIDVHAKPERANDLMKENGIRHLGVTEDGEIVGIVSVRDLLHYFTVYYGGIGALKQKSRA